MPRVKNLAKLGKSKELRYLLFRNFPIALPKARCLENRLETKLYPHVNLKFLIFQVLSRFATHEIVFIESSFHLISKSALFVTNLTCTETQ